MANEELVASTPPTDLDAEVFNATGARMTVRALRERVTLLEPGIVLLREVAGGTPETLRVMGARIEELGKAFDSYGVVIDLTEASGGTTPEYRRFIPEQFASIAARSKGALRHVGVAFFGNPVLRVAVKFLVARTSEVPFGIYKDVASATEGVRASLR